MSNANENNKHQTIKMNIENDKIIGKPWSCKQFFLIKINTINNGLNPIKTKGLPGSAWWNASLQNLQQLWQYPTLLYSKTIVCILQYTETRSNEQSQTSLVFLELFFTRLQSNPFCSKLSWCCLSYFLKKMGFQKRSFKSYVEKTY